MALGSYESHCVENLAVNLLLGWKAFEGIFFAFYLIPMEIAIDYGNIDPDLTLAQPKFVNDDSLRIISEDR
jgi:hypothetical protein